MILHTLHLFGPVSHLPAVLSDIQGLVFHHPVDVRLRIPAGLAVQNSSVSLVDSGVLWLHLEANIHLVCKETRANTDRQKKMQKVY